METIKPIDFSLPEFQGHYGHDRIDQLVEPGYYTLPFMDSYGHLIVISVNVEDVVNDGRAQIIVVRRKDDNFQDFYYNGFQKMFKPLSEPWVVENTYDECWDLKNMQATIPDYLYGMLVVPRIPVEEL